LKGDSRIVPVDPLRPDPEVLDRAVSILRSGGVVVFPTQLLYGLGADARNPAAVARVFEIKRRPAEKPVSILISRIDMLKDLVTGSSAAARAIMDRLWPGGVTLVFSADPGLPGNLTATSGKIGIRLPMHPVSASLCRAANIPITATSANLSGHPGCSRIDMLPESIIAEVDLVLDTGPLPGGPGSTVLDVSVDPPKILREGMVPAERIRAVMEG